MSLTKRWVVYQHLNLVNGKRYIGITCKKPEHRWNNGKGYGNNTYFTRAVQKYGWDSFRHDILYTDLSRAEAERLEMELIAKYQANNPEKGYNTTAGGDGVRGLNHTPETKAKMSAAHKGHVVTEETRAKISAANMGHTFTDETRKKMSVARKNRVVKPETRAKLSATISGAGNPIARSVRCVETGVVYATITEAGAAVGTHSGHISSCCKGKPHHKTAGGYHWEYVDTPIFDTQNS